jgi:hypothetical protein
MRPTSRRSSAASAMSPLSTSSRWLGRCTFTRASCSKTSPPTEAVRGRERLQPRESANTPACQGAQPLEQSAAAGHCGLVDQWPGVENGLKQHVVSATLLRRWADGGTLVAYYLATGKQRRRSPKAEGFIRGLVRDGADAVEARWSRIEQHAPAVFSALDDGTLVGDPVATGHLKDLFALHFARSRTMIDVYLRSTAGTAERMLSDPDSVTQNGAVLDEYFRERTGLEPAGPAARLWALEAIEADVTSQFAPGSEFFVERLVSNYERIRGDLDGWGVQIGITDSAEFLIGDDPVQTVDSTTGRVGVLSGVTIPEADALLMPFGPHHVAAVANEDSTLAIGADGVDRLNRIQVISARTKVYFRPGSPLAEAVARHWASRHGADV